MQIVVQYVIVINEQYRMLPTIRGDVDMSGQVTDQLLEGTLARYEEVYEICDASPISLEEASQVVRVNVAKRNKAFQRTMAEVAANPHMNKPPDTYLPTIMNVGAPIPGIEDRYLDDDYPSREVFAFNRLGKSFTNERFARHCLLALDIAYPESDSVEVSGGLRVKAHRLLPNSSLAVVSSKQVIGARRRGERETSLISRTTGVIDLDTAAITHDERFAILKLIDYENTYVHDGGFLPKAEASLCKAALRGLILDGTREDSVNPVIQTVYQAQLNLALR